MIMKYRRMKVKLHTFLTLALDRGNLQRLSYFGSHWQLVRLNNNSLYLPLCCEEVIYRNKCGIFTI
jgi:hypothetical protein